MRGTKLSAGRLRWRAAIAGSLLFVGAFALFATFHSLAPPEQSDMAHAEVGVADTPAPVGAPDQAERSRPEEQAPVPTRTVSEVALRCPELLDYPADKLSYGYPSADRASDDCWQALDAHFLVAPTAEALFPLEQPLTWNDVFNGVAARFQRVATAINDPGCQVAGDELRPELAEQCAARDMAELSMLGDMCGRVDYDFDALAHHGELDSEVYLSTLDELGRDEAIANLDEGRRYTGNTAYLNMPAHVSDVLNAPLVDQAEYWRQRERVDDVYFRTAWAHSRCDRERETLRAMLPRAEEWADLMARAAGFADEFALTHRQLNRARTLRLRATNLPLAWVHLAALSAMDVEDDWRRANVRALDELEDRPPHFQNRLRAMEMAGVQCPLPCTPDRLRRTEKQFEDEIEAFQARIFQACDLRQDCAASDALIALHEPLSQAMDSEEMDRGRAKRRTRYGKLAEAIRVQYTFAVEALAAERGVPVRADSLRRVLAHPEAPRYLDAAEVETFRNDAERLVANVLARTR